MLTREAVDTRSDCALVGKVTGDAALVLGSRPADESRVEDQTIFGCVSFCLQGSTGQCAQGLEGDGHTHTHTLQITALATQEGSHYTHVYKYLHVQLKHSCNIGLTLASSQVFNPTWRLDILLLL